jgi:phosphorylase/glycogen(starch) synthase
MLNDYMTRYYLPLYERKCKIVENDFELAKELSSWKKKAFRSWESIEVLSVKTPDVLREQIMVGSEYKCEVVVDLNELDPEDIGVEFLIVEMLSENGRATLYEQKEFHLTSVNGRTAVYEVSLLPMKTGAFEFGIRMFPKNPALPHRQDFSLVKWV